jgi:hypothetical protein
MADPTTTAANLATAQQNLVEAEQAHATAIGESAEPRPPMTVLGDILAWVVMRVGNHPVIEKLVNEFKGAVERA